MAIKNKDGTVYQLKGPNPVMKTQTQWESDKKIVFHNFKWQGETVESDKEVKTIEPEAKKWKPIPEPEISRFEPPKPEPKPEPQPIVVEKPKEQIKMEGKIQIHCLPANLKSYHDDLYDEVRSKYTYDTKFKFEGVIIEQYDSQLRIWTTVENIPNGSIIYPQNRDKRWWRVIERHDVDSGYLFDCVPSSDQPDFS